MKKFILSVILVFGYNNSLAAEPAHYYAFMMRAVPIDDDYLQSNWQKSVNLTEAFVQYLYDTESDESKEGFSICIMKSIDIIKDVFALCENDKNILIDVGVYHEPLDLSGKNLFIALEYRLENENSIKNHSEIEALMAEIEINCHQKDRDKLIESLKNLDVALQLTSGGEVWLHVNY